MKFHPNPENDDSQLKKNLDFERITASDKDVDWNQDPKSYFTIMPFINENRILVRAYSTDHKGLYLISGETPKQIYYKIIKMGLISKLEHAAYLGKELEKAYIALKRRLYFNQDDELSWEDFIEPTIEEEKAFYEKAQREQVFPNDLRGKLIVLNYFAFKHLKQGFVYSQSELEALAKRLFPDNHQLVIFELLDLGFVTHNLAEDDYVVVATKVGYD